MPNAISNTLSQHRRLLASTVAAIVAMSAGVARAQAEVTPNATVGSKQMCAYTGNSVSNLGTFASTVGAPALNCAEVYDDGSSWSSWANPWFTGPAASGNWPSWVNTAPSGQSHQLMISLSLGPTSESSDPNWRAEGASGEDNGYATQLATNLVNAGLGNSIIVLAAEANGTWDADNIGTTPQNMSDWVSFWRNTVMAMRAVPGASFTFVWTVNDRVPAIPFDEYYPGNDVVNVIGDDIYDNSGGWNWSYGGPEGLGALISFAAANDKPIGFPEWGTGSPTAAVPSGDDPQFVSGIAQVVATQNVAFQSYFYSGRWQTQLTGGPLGFAAYRSAFGAGSSATASAGSTASVGATDPATSPTVPSSPPASTPSQSTSASSPTKPTVSGVSQATGPATTKAPTTGAASTTTRSATTPVTAAASTTRTGKPVTNSGSGVRRAPSRHARPARARHRRRSARARRSRHVARARREPHAGR